MIPLSEYQIHEMERRCDLLLSGRMFSGTESEISRQCSFSDLPRATREIRRLQGELKIALRKAEAFDWLIEHVEQMTSETKHDVTQYKGAPK